MSFDNQGPSRRVQKVERALRETISQYLISGYKGRRRGLVTVTRVLVAADLQKAKIFISVLGSHEDKSITFEDLEEHIPEIRRYIGKELNMRYCPKIIIAEDRSNEGLSEAFNT